MVELIIAWCLVYPGTSTNVCAHDTVAMGNVTELQCAINGYQAVVRWKEAHQAFEVKRWTCKFRELPEFAVKGE